MDRLVRLPCQRSKKNELAAELSYWYGFDASTLPIETQYGYKANLPRLHAQSQIQNQQYDPTDYQGVYELFMQAYGDDELATRVKTKALESLVRSETEAARCR